MPLQFLVVSGRVLKELRAKVRMEQTTFGKMFGVSQAQICLWETERRQIRVNQRALSRIPCEHEQLRGWLLDQGLKQLSAKLEREAASGKLFGALPLTYVRKNHEHIVSAIAEDLRHRWLGS
jgi:hypothetical protein